MSTTHGFVFARGGSKGLPGKNLLDLAGKPLIAHTIELALSMPEFDDVYVSTDDREIAAVAASCGAQVIDRPAELATDDSPELLSWKHAAEVVTHLHGPFSRFVSLPATSPLRDAADVRACVQALDKDTDLVVCVAEASHNPWFNMVRMDSEGSVQLLLAGGQRVTRRQDAPKAFDLTTVAYAARTEYVVASENLLEGRVRGVCIPRERAVDIDTPLDFEFAEFLMSRRDAIGDKRC